MAALSKILRSIEGDGIGFWCPGCDEAHVVTVGAGGWTWNGDVDRPTISPSILVTGAQIERDAAGKWTGEWLRGPDGKPLPDVCHSYVVDGNIQFLGDCTHKLAGQTTPIPPWPT